MDKDRIEGKMKDVKGRVKRQVGEWTGNAKTEAEGAAEQAKGKIQNAWGKAKDAGRDALDRSKQPEQVNKQRVERKKADAA
jgi:uncharacterized protein YjbJ (UPF0337 family)